MRIGLIRHFTVVQPYMTSKWVNPAGFYEWVEGYNSSEIHLDHFSVTLADWPVCYSSDLTRALRTARHIYPGPVVATPLLREIMITLPWNTSLRLPFWLWELIGRTAWVRSRLPQKETRADVHERLSRWLEEVGQLGEQSVLAVSHGGLMYYLRRELLRRGFLGPFYRIPENGKLYIFEKKA